MPTIDSQLLGIYKKTVFWVKDFNQRLVRFSSRTAARLPFLKKKKFAVLTAWNPMNRVLSLRTNRAYNRRLESDLKKTGYYFYKTTGSWQKHLEESYTVEGISERRAAALGAKYRQYAILYNDHRGVRFIRCPGRQKKPAKASRP